VETRGAAEIVEAEVRELVRRRGVDPLREHAATRALIDEALATCPDLPPLADATAIARAVFDAVAGLGPVQRYLDDPDVEEIWINSPARVFVARHARSELTNVVIPDEAVKELVERMLRASGRRLDLSSPFVDAVLADGSRLHVVIPDVTRQHWVVNIRKHIVRAHSLDELVALGSLPRQAARFLEAAVAAGLNLIVSGGTQAGKTTLLNALASAVPASERVVSCEEVFELRLAVPDWVAMQTRQANLEGAGEITLRRLVTEALRMRPSRIVVGEVRQAEALDLLIALNSGVPGLCTVHANSGREALVKLCTLPLLAGQNVGAAFVVPTVAAAVDLVIHTGLDGAGRRRVREVLAVSGRVEGSTVEASDVFGWRGGQLTRGEGFPPHEERFAAAGIDLAELLRPPPGPGAAYAPVRPRTSQEP
jgi:pilus assembly protein CpaF